MKSNLDRVDVLLVHCVRETGLACAATIFRKVGKPVLVSAHGMLVRWELRGSRVAERIARMCVGTGALLNRPYAVLYGAPRKRRMRLRHCGLRAGSC